MRTGLPSFRPGDTIRVHTKIREGDKERIQIFEGIVLQKRGGGVDASFTVRKTSFGVGVERIFPLSSPWIDRIEVMSRGKVRRARLTYLRTRMGKAARIKTERWDEVAKEYDTSGAADGETKSPSDKKDASIAS